MPVIRRNPAKKSSADVLRVSFVGRLFTLSSFPDIRAAKKQKKSSRRSGGTSAPLQRPWDFMTASVNSFPSGKSAVLKLWIVSLEALK